VVRFYRWRYRQANWQSIDSEVASPHDYYVLTPRDAGIIQERGLRVLYRDQGLILAR